MFHNFPKKFPSVRIIWLIFKLEALAVGHEFCELGRNALTELLNAGRELLVLDQVVFLVLCLGLDAHPGQGALEEVDKDVPDGAHVVSSALLVAQMRVNGRIPGCPDKASFCGHFHMLTCFYISVHFAQAEVDQVHYVAPLAMAQHEIFRFYVPVNETSRVKVLYSVKHLLS